MALAQHALVKAIGVAAVPDDVRGEEVLACIIPGRAIPPEQQHGAAEDIVRFALQRLAYFKAPGYVYFCDALPRTATEKIQRGELRRLARDALEGARVVDTRALKKRVPARRSGTADE
jgi:acyl-coenzyme A synthetase/AMP-(fatty) acid ligase